MREAERHLSQSHTSLGNDVKHHLTSGSANSPRSATLYATRTCGAWLAAAFLLALCSGPALSQATPAPAPSATITEASHAPAGVPSPSTASTSAPPAEKSVAGTSTAIANAPVAAPTTSTSPATSATSASPEAPATPTMKAKDTGPARAHLPYDLSPWGMFQAADIVVKGVMTFLALASLLVWTAWIGKVVQLRSAKRGLKQRAEAVARIASLSEIAGIIGRDRDVAAVMAMAARTEVEKSQAGRLPAAGIKERVTSELARIENAAGRAMNKGTGILATVGGTAPFIGLFGTVWGIMNSFIGISKAQTTNLAVVAPGIAEALLATAIGLVAAIPAVMFYNQLARAITEYRAELADFGASLERLVSRDLDCRDMASMGTASPPANDSSSRHSPGFATLVRPGGV